MAIPIWLQATLWGFVAASALLIGAVIAYFTRISTRTIAVIVAFGSGVLIGLVAFGLLDAAYSQGGTGVTVLGALSGACVYTLVDRYLTGRGAKYRKRSGQQQPVESQVKGSGLAIAIGSLLDDVPESMVIGISFIGGGTVSVVTVAGIFLSDVAEAISSAAGMKRARRSGKYVFGVWGVIALFTGFASLAGYAIFSKFSTVVIAAAIATAAGAIFAMVADEMLPEAFPDTRSLCGFFAVLGFLCFFVLSKLAL